MYIESVIESFDSIINNDCDTLILGTMPGNESLNSSQYYGHPNNVFWDIILRTFKNIDCEFDCSELPYEEKINLLLNNKIGIWDVLKFCNRKGNLDNKIRNEIKNDFDIFFSEYKNIKNLIFNGQTAEKYFTKSFKHLILQYDLTITTLPSTSPTNSLNTFTKLRLWKSHLKP